MRTFREPEKGTFPAPGSAEELDAFVRLQALLRGLVAIDADRERALALFHSTVQVLDEEAALG